MRLAAGFARSDVYNLLRMRNRQRTKQDGIEQTEHGRVGADSQGEREHGNDGKSGTLDQHTDAVSQILHQCSHLFLFPIPSPRQYHRRQRVDGSIARRAHSYLSATSGSTLVARRAGM